MRYRSQLFTLPSAGAYTVTFRAEGNAMAEVWDDRLISTRSLRVNPVQIVLSRETDSISSTLDHGSHHQVRLVGGDGVGNGLRSGDGVHRPLCPHPSTRLVIVDWTGHSTVVRAE